MAQGVRRFAWQLLLLAVVAAGAATIAGFAARYWWPLELACHFRVQYFLILAVGSALLALRRRWLPTILAAAFACANLAVIVPFYLPVREPESSGGKVYRILSYNVREFGYQFESTIELIRSTEADLVILLEMNHRWQQELRELEIVDGYKSYQRRGVSIYTRLPFETYEAADRATVGLPALLARVDLDGQPLTLIGAHPNSPDGKEFSRNRNEQLADLKRFAVAATKPLIVVGDLNTTSWSPYFRDLLEAAHLRDSRLGYGVQPTFPSIFPPALIPIDHCLVSPEIAIHSRRVGPLSGSDHYPIIVDFSIEARRSPEPATAAPAAASEHKAAGRN